MRFVKLVVLSLFLFIITMHKLYYCSALLESLNLSGYLGFEEHAIDIAAKDFGNRYESPPLAVLYPSNVFDIAKTVETIFELGMSSELTVAARGHGHSLHGQAQALGGLVIMMESLEEPIPIPIPIRVCDIDDGNNYYYVDVLGGSLWIDVLQKCLEHGLAPKSWTDYLHLTVGGTLSNAGVSGQAFRHGPQITNVKELDIVTGTGEVLKCSEEENSDLFFGALGGLGQFGIITRARIILEPAPNMVRWIRVLYSDFSDFTRDQELLISKENTFDYIEGFVIKNRSGILNNWRSFLYPKDPIQANMFDSEGRTLFCLEMTKNFNTNDTTNLDQEIDELLSQLRYIPSTLFQSEVGYLDFLNRVHTSAEKLKSQNLWDVPHPWLNLMVPRTKIHDFSDEVFGKIITHSNNGPIIIYPVNKSKWDNRTSAVLLDGEEIFYMVSFLSSVPSLTDHQSLQLSLNQNENILEFCKKAGIPVKQYLPHYTTQEDWKKHFGHKWEQFVRRKSMYDPLAILAPGQRIFQKNIPISEYR